MKRLFRLTRASDFKRAKASGSVIKHPLVVMVFVRNQKPYSRAAVVASKNVGNAVTRNRIKRRMRACLDTIWCDIAPSWDMIFYARNDSVEVDYVELQKAISTLLIRAGVFLEKEKE